MITVKDVHAADYLQCTIGDWQILKLLYDKGILSNKEITSETKHITIKSFYMRIHVLNLRLKQLGLGKVINVRPHGYCLDQKLTEVIASTLEKIQ